MVQFKFVKEVPKTLEKGDYVIEAPTFMEEILSQKVKAPKNGLTGAYHIRAVTDAVAFTYNPESMTAYSVKSHLYEGVAFKSDEELSDIFVNMYKNECPELFLKYVETRIKNRPTHTKVIYYVDSDIKGAYDLFYRHGFTELKDSKPTKEKSTKVVGKPAITDEEAQSTND